MSDPYNARVEEISRQYTLMRTVNHIVSIMSEGTRYGKFLLGEKLLVGIHQTELRFYHLRGDETYTELAAVPHSEQLVKILENCESMTMKHRAAYLNAYLSTI